LLDINSYEDEIVVGTLLFKHLQFLQFNSHEIYETDNNNISNLFYKDKQISIGIGIYPHAARFNHECYSATIR
jgi:uncharacterized pyridoxamine 5'-phosphate oxidase family protein